LKEILDSEDKIINTLFVTDLDGTLLNDNAELSQNSYKILQELISKGVNFTVATGRTLDNTIAVLDDLSFNLPIITDNGTFVYDTNEKKFLQQQSFNIEDVESIVDIAVEHGVMPFINTLDKNGVHVYYNTLYNEAVDDYYKQKIENKTSNYVKDDSYTIYKKETVFNLSMMDTHNRLLPIYEYAKQNRNIKITLFPSHYYKGYYWLEVLPKNSGKGEALNFFKKKYNPEKIVCFGDNLNDLCMFQLSDHKVAPANAVDKIIDISDEIIGHCNDDSVAKYIRDNY
jgi:Cof subfamily protein (haloacid dehalogenase superfamily)